jgi:hypothetical protein
VKGRVVHRVSRREVAVSSFLYVVL